MGSPSVSPLLAVLLVTSSSRGAHIAFQYPRRPKVEKRYSQVRYHVEEDEKAKIQYILQEDEMDDDFEGEVEELTEDEESTGESDSDSDDLIEVDENHSDFEGLPNRRDADMASSSAGGTNQNNGATKDVHQRAKRLKAYQQYLGYDIDILAFILSPKRELCHRKFELVIDDLAFIGHPVCVDKDGKWDADMQQHQQEARGRSMKHNEDAVEGYTIGDQLPEEQAASQPTQQSQASMTMFHFVLVLDRPDPSPHLPILDLTTWLQIFYDNIAFKTTAALFAEEVRSEYISRESEKLIMLRDRCMDDAQSYANFLTQELNFSSLARSLKQIYSSISISSNAFITINDVIDVHLQLPPILQDPKRMLRIADLETPLDVNDAVYSRRDYNGPSDIEDLIFEEWTRTTGPFLLPWKTLLLLNEDESEGLSESHSSGDIFGHPNLSNEERVDSWAKQFCQLLQPRLSGIPTFAEIADLLSWNLEDDVYPMVRHLIYYREARVVDVPRIQNYYAFSPLFDLKDLAHLSISWSHRFSSLPPLASFLAKLSSSLTQFSTLCRKDQKSLCLDALIWLLRHQIVVQMHVRLRLIAGEAAKKRAAELRGVERDRVEELRKKRRTVSKALQSTQDGDKSEFPRSAPAAATSVETAGTSERGRSRERSTSPMSQEEKASMEEPKVSITSALSATRPDGVQQGQAATSSSATATKNQGLRVLADQVEELRFERRPVLRSRSPSRILAIAAEKNANSSLRGRGRSSGSSRPTTPRGRGRGFGQPRESSGAPPLLDTKQHGDVQSQPQSVPVLTNTQQAVQRQHRSITREDGNKNATSRSPSRARMRVTGFGEGEEVHVESESGSIPSSKSSEPRAGLSQSLLRNAADMEAIRRLSLVGEDVEAEVSLPDVAVECSRNSPESQEESLEEDIEVEPWEIDPVATIIVEPSRAGGEENEWIAVMVEDKPPLLAQRLFKLLPFLNGKHTIDEIVYRLDWRRKDLRAVLVAFKNEILTLVHP